MEAITSGVVGERTRRRGEREQGEIQWEWGQEKGWTANEGRSDENKGMSSRSKKGRCKSENKGRKEWVRTRGQAASESTGTNSGGQKRGRAARVRTSDIGVTDMRSTATGH